jgi:DNA polymerase III subunit gamma/tau
VELASRAEVDDLSRLFQGFSRAFDEIVRSGQPRTALEMALVRLARRPPLLPLDELLARVGDLERRLGGAPPPGPAPRGGGGGGGGRSVPSAPPSIHTPAGGARTHGSLALVAPLPAVVQPLPAQPPLRPPPPQAVAPSALAAAAHAQGSAPDAWQTVATVSPSASPDMSAWRAVITRLRETQAAFASFFEHALPLEITASRVVVGFEVNAAFQASRAAEPEAMEALTRAVRAHFGAPTQVLLEAVAKTGPATRTLASLEAERRSADLAAARAAVEAHPLVQEAIRVFGAPVCDVKLPGADG